MTEMYERNVVLAADWARLHEEALTRVFKAFERDGEWPDGENLQRELNRSGSTHDLIAELRDLPPSLGVFQGHGRVALSVRGLSFIPGARPLLEAYMKVITLAVGRYRGVEEQPRITDEDLRTELGMDDELAKRVGGLVFGEGWPFGSGGGEADGSWYRDVPIELRHLIAAGDIDDFLAVQAKLRYGPPAPAHNWPAQLVSAAPAVTAVTVTSEPAPGNAMASRTVAEPAGVTSRTFQPLSPKIFRRLVFGELAKLKAEKYFVEGFEEGEHVGIAPDGEPVIAPPHIENPEAWLMLNLNREGLWPQLQNPESLASPSSPSTQFDDQGLLLRTLELLYRDVVSRPVLDPDGSFEGFYELAAGQARLREAVAPILERLQPSLEMRADGEIAAKSAPGLEVLGDQPLPTSAIADDIRAKVLDAIRAFRDVDATVEAQFAALSQLAGILERLREDKRLNVLGKKDQGSLFDIANNYGIRHDKRDQKRDYGPAFREWIFFAYLAAIRLAMRVAEGDDED